jgi:phosphoenolpyruvate-protein phosphotransferase (PTS system enzyme I)
MLALHGIGVSDGVCIGKAYVLRRELPEIPEYTIAKHQVDAEIARFAGAVDAARQQLQSIRAHIPASAPVEATSFIDTHLLILDDKMISEGPKDIIRHEHRNAESALRKRAEELSATFERMDDAYLRNKKIDVNQVLDRVLRNLLMQNLDEHERVGVGAIVVAHDLTPADTVLLKHRHIKAFVTNMGSPISHTAILARSLGIPAVVSAHSATRYIRHGEDLVVDGKRGVLLLSPDARALAEYRRLKQRILEKQRALERLRRSAPITADGKRVHLFANIELPADVRAAIQAGAEGIGLYRTEFLYMNRAGPPGEEEQ